jgi:hypothetical protein
MRYNGNLELVGEIQGLKPHRRAVDPAGDELAQGLVWVNTAEGVLRWYDGTTIHTIATGGSLEDYLSKEGGTLTGPLILAANGVEALEAVTVQQLEASVDALGDTKQDTITGAASTIVTDNLTPSVVAVTDADGKITSSALISVAELNQLEGVTDNVQTQLDLKQEDLGYTPVNKAGDALTGDLNFGGTHTLLNLSAPTDPTSPVRLIDLDNMKAGLDFQQDVLATQVDGDLDPTTFTDVPEAAQRFIITNAADLNPAFGTIDGLADGDIVAREGDAYVVVYDVSEQGPGVLVWDREAVKYKKYDGTNWSEQGGLSGVTVSAGLEKNGNVLSVKFGAGVANLPTGEIGLDVDAAQGLRLVDPTSGEVSTGTDAVLALLLKDTGGLSVDSTGLRIAAEGVKASNIAADVAGNGLEGGAGTALAVKAADATVVVDSTGIKIGDLSASYLSLADDAATITGQIAVPAPTADESIANRKTVTDAVSIVSQSVTDLSTRVDGNQFVFDGTQGAAQAVYAIQHNMGNRFVSVDIYDETYGQLLPDSVVLTDANTVTVTLALAQKIRAVVTGKKVIAA